MQKLLLISAVLALTSCVSTKNTIKNIDNNAPVPALTKDDNFKITEFASDARYGYDPDYPINIFYKNTVNDSINQRRYLKALAGPNGEEISYVKVETCCPFPTKHSTVGAGLLEIYEIKWNKQKQPIRLYLNIYEKGVIQVPVGLTLKK